MIALLFPSLVLFLFGLLFCSFTTLHPTKKLLKSWLQSSPTQQNPPHIGAPTTTVSSGGGRAEELRSVFAAFDTDKDGYVTRGELRESLKNMGIVAGEEDLDDMVRNVDCNGDGLIDFVEFSSVFGSKTEDGDLKGAFDVFDGNGDGRITVEELGSVLCSMGFAEGKMVENCEEMIRKVDVDGDGMVSFDEFKGMMVGMRGVFSSASAPAPAP